MKKLFLFFLSISLVTLVDAQVKLGLKAGINIANQKYTSGGISLSGDSKIGFTGGVILDAELSDNFAFQPGLLFSQKGMKMTSSSNGSSSTADLTLNYLDFPLNLMYKINTGSIKVLLSAGPVICVGLSGKGTVDGESADIKFGSGTDADFKSMDMGLSIGGGIQIDQVQLGINYTFGLSNIAPTSQGVSSDITAKNNVLTISAAILF